MKILVINPVGHSTWDEQDRIIYESFASPETKIDVISLPKGPASVETPEAHGEVIPLIIDVAKKYSKDYNAVIVNCFLDPAVDLLKNILRIPVIGPCESSLAIASLIGRKIGIVTVGNDALWMIEDRVKQLNFHGIVNSVRGISLGVLDLDKDKIRTKHLLIEEIRKSINEDKIDTTILGCTGLAGFAEEVQKIVKIPVIDPAGAALKMAEAIVKLRFFK